MGIFLNISTTNSFQAHQHNGQHVDKAGEVRKQPGGDSREENRGVGAGKEEDRPAAL